MARAMAPTGSAPAVPLIVETPFSGMVIWIFVGSMFELPDGNTGVVNVTEPPAASGAPPVLRTPDCRTMEYVEPEASDCAGVKVTWTLPSPATVPGTRVPVVMFLTIIFPAAEAGSTAMLNVATAWKPLVGTSVLFGVMERSCSGFGASTSVPKGTLSFLTGALAATVGSPSPVATLRGLSD